MSNISAFSNSTWIDCELAAKDLCLSNPSANIATNKSFPALECFSSYLSSLFGASTFDYCATQIENATESLGFFRGATKEGFPKLSARACLFDSLEEKDSCTSQSAQKIQNMGQVKGCDQNATVSIEMGAKGEWTKGINLGQSYSALFDPKTDAKPLKGFFTKQLALPASFFGAADGRLAAVASPSTSSLVDDLQLFCENDLRRALQSNPKLSAKVERFVSKVFSGPSGLCSVPSFGQLGGNKALTKSLPYVLMSSYTLFYPNPGLNNLEKVTNFILQHIFKVHIEGNKNQMYISTEISPDLQDLKFEVHGPEHETLVSRLATDNDLDCLEKRKANAFCDPIDGLDATGRVYFDC